VQSLHHVLDRKDLADLVIPDLARWGDWSQVSRLEKLFVEAEKDNNWIRVPVVNYLRACPNPEAAEAIERLKAIDPESVKRASSFFSIPTPAPAPTPANSSYRVPVGLKKLLPVASVGRHLPASIGGKYSDAKLAAAPFFSRTEHAFAIAHGMKQPALATVAPANWMSVASVYVLTLTSMFIGLYIVLSGGRFRSHAAI
jgi:hypothetical protein